jgi:hypothetical protein
MYSSLCGGLTAHFGGMDVSLEKSIESGSVVTRPVAKRKRANRHDETRVGFLIGRLRA